MSICSCRVCGCTDTRACEGGCWWAEPDLCSTCARKLAVRERPILFSGPMVRALLDGRKTQTRRVMKKPPTGVHGLRLASANCPYGRSGDRLWVRETWAHVPATAYRCSDGVQQTNDPTSAGMAAVYAAAWERSAPGRWKPSIHMPRWACRLVLEISDVRVQRLQGISENDAIAEGVDGPMCAELATKTPWRDVCAPVAVHTYAALWDSINGAGAWLANPWIWALTFKPVSSPDKDLK